MVASLRRSAAMPGQKEAPGGGGLKSSDTTGGIAGMHNIALTVARTQLAVRIRPTTLALLSGCGNVL